MNDSVWSAGKNAWLSLVLSERAAPGPRTQKSPGALLLQHLALSSSSRPICSFIPDCTFFQKIIIRDCSSLEKKGEKGEFSLTQRSDEQRGRGCRQEERRVCGRPGSNRTREKISGWVERHRPWNARWQMEGEKPSALPYTS